MRRVYLAGNEKEFLEIAATRKWSKKNFRYIKDVDYAKRLPPNTKVSTLGTWEKRPDILELITILRSKGCIFTHEEEKQNATE